LGSEVEAELIAWRRLIDTIDDQLIRLLDSRTVCAVEIGRIKRSLGMPASCAERRDQALRMARAAVAAGADGLLIEVHHDPDHAPSDGPQSLLPEQFDRLMGELRVIAPVLRRSVPFAR
jgi:3-deoxy-7-phosphoheptulonate synthase